MLNTYICSPCFIQIFANKPCRWMGFVISKLLLAYVATSLARFLLTEYVTSYISKLANNTSPLCLKLFINFSIEDNFHDLNELDIVYFHLLSFWFVVSNGKLQIHFFSQFLIELLLLRKDFFYHQVIQWAGSWSSHENVFVFESQHMVLTMEISQSFHFIY